MVLGNRFRNFVIRTGNWEEFKKLTRKVHETGLLDLLTRSGRPHTSRSCVMQPGAVTDWWYSWPMASKLASLCLSQRRTFWTYVVTTNLFSLYLMKFMLNTMLDAAGVVLRVHYKSMKCGVLFSQGSVRTVFRWGGNFSYISKKFLPLYNSAKIIKIDRDFPKLWSQMSCHLFMVHSVHVAQISQADCAAEWFSYDQKWNTGTGRQYFTDIIGLPLTTLT